MKQHYIYLTTNLINNNKYIGKHYGELDDNYFGSGNLIHAAIVKYGKQNFKKEILYISKDEEENSEKEIEFIKAFNAVERNDFYNLTDKKMGFFTEKDRSYTQTPEFRQKISEVTTGEKNGMYGKHHSEESKRKISENRKGKTVGEKNGMYGKKGDNAINGKKIDMFDLSWNYVKTFNSKGAALAFLGLKGHTQLDKAIKNSTEYKGYYWKNHE